MKTENKSQSTQEKLVAIGAVINIKDGTRIVNVDPLFKMSSKDRVEYAQRIVKAMNMHNELIEVIKTTKDFFDSMPKGQFGKISCDVGLMNDMFLGISKVLKQAEQK